MDFCLIFNILGSSEFRSLIALRQESESVKMRKVESLDKLIASRAIVRAVASAV